MNDLPKVSIATIDMSDTVSGMLDFLCENPKARKFEISSTNDEQVCIIQMPGSAVSESLRSYRKEYPDRQVIVIFKSEVKGKNITSLIPPLTPQRLLEALNKVAIDLDANQPSKQADAAPSASAQVSPVKTPQVIADLENVDFFSSRADIDLNDPKEVDKIRYPADRFMQGHFQRAVKKGNVDKANVQFTTPHGVFQYYPEIRRAHAKLFRYSLRHLSSVPDTLDDSEVKFDSEVPPTNTGKKQTMCIDTLLWDLTIWASRGRLPAEVDLDQTFILKNWPNFTRWTLTLHAMQITVFWLDNPVSLRESVDQLEIPQRYIFTFYCAALAVGLIEILDDGAGSAGIKKVAVKKTPARLKGFIGKILQYVKPETEEEV